MTKVIIGGFVGGALIFLWQFASWTFFDLHRSQQEYTPNQDTILTFLGTQINGDGAFFLPNVSKNASKEEQQKAMETSIGKPWAQVFYHTEMKNNMTINMVRGFAVNVVIVFLFIFIMGKIQENNFATVFFSSLAVGLIVFFNSPYTLHIWYETFDVWGHLLDALLSWALVGLWLGWWLNRGK